MTRPARPDDRALRELLIQDATRGWRAFIDGYTPLILSVIEQAGVTSRDDAMEVYVLVCDRFAENDCQRLRRHDPSKGTLATWVGTLVRNGIVDWVRSRAGRRRLFGSIAELDRTDGRVFEEFYWNHRGVTEIAELVRDDAMRPIGIAAVFAALERIERALNARQRAELLTFASRRPPISLDAEGEALDLTAPEDSSDPETRLRRSDAKQALDRALAELPEEDRLIVKFRVIDGLTLAEISRALGRERVTAVRLQEILSRLRVRLAVCEGELS